VKYLSLNLPLLLRFERNLTRLTTSNMNLDLIRVKCVWVKKFKCDMIKSNQYEL